METMKCDKCGNKTKWLHKTIEYEICYYDTDGNIEDAKSVDIDSSVPISCGVCWADIEGDK
jgi:hypothetical protein